MTERAISEENLLSGLRDIHLPGEAAGGIVADLAAAGALACALALVVAGALRMFSLRKRAKAMPTLQDQIAASRALPETERRVVLLHMLKQHNPQRFAEIKQTLYRPGSSLDADKLVAELVRHA